jgi:ABC-type branched-chain amino acid transport systems, periplasmic component
MRKSISWLFVLLSFVFITCAAFAGKAEAKPYVVGAFVSVTGPNSTLGTPERDTLKMIETKINKNGGINGHPLKVIIEDDASDNTNAVKAANKLINQDYVCAIIGGSGTGPSLAVAPIAEANGVAQISMAAGLMITNPVKKWVFRVAITDSIIAGKMLNYLAQQKLNRIAIIYDSNAYGTSGRDQLRALASKYNVTIAAEEAFASNDTDMTVQLTKIRTTNVKAIVCWGTNPGPAQVAKNHQQLGITIPLFMSHGMANQTFLDQAGAAAEGIVLPAEKLVVADQLPASDPQKKVLLQFDKDYQQLYKTPADQYAGHAWDALNIVIGALRKAGDNRAKLRDEIEKTANFTGIAGIFTFSAADHDGLTSDAGVMLKIKDGKWTLLKK